MGKKEELALIESARAKAKETNAKYFYVGDEGRFITVYEDRAAIRTKQVLFSSYSGIGEKTIYFVDCTGVQFKPGKGMCRGLLQLETASMDQTPNQFYNENSFVWDAKKSEATNEKMEEVRDFIQEKIREIKSPKPATVVQNTSAADDILKYKNLLDAGIITQEEFDAKKKQLLGL